MYEDIIFEASKIGYNGLNYYRYYRDDFLFASNVVAMSDDSIKTRTNKKSTLQEEHYLGFTRKKDELTITYYKDKELLVKELLEKIGRHKLFIDQSAPQNSNILNDIQGIYYVINHIYVKIYDVLINNDRGYVIYNKQPLSGNVISKDLIENMTSVQKKTLIETLEELFSSHRELSNHFDEIIDNIKKLCNYNKTIPNETDIVDFIKNINTLKEEIEGLLDKDILNFRNKIIKIKNTINALRYLRENNYEKYLKYCKYEKQLTNELKQQIIEAYIFFFNNRNNYRLDEIINYFNELLVDPQTLSSRHDKEKPLCEEIYQEIINDIGKDKIPQISNKDEFKVFTMRISAPCFCQYRLLETYEKGKPLCRMSVYKDMIPRIFGTFSNKLKNRTIEQVADTYKYTIYDSVICSPAELKRYLNEIDLTEENMKKVIRIFYSVDYLDVLIDSIPKEKLDTLENEIIAMINEDKITARDYYSAELYKHLLKRSEN